MIKAIVRTFRKYLIPHKHNNYHPHFVRNSSIGAVIGILLLFFVATSAYVSHMQSNDHFLSAVLPSVLVDLTNNDRYKRSIPTLKVNPLLEKAAQLKADHMANHGYFAHTSPDGISPWYWMAEVGYGYMIAGENLAVHFKDSEMVEKAWMNSPSHRANILNYGYTEIGIATARGEFEGFDTVFVVQMFGAPRVQSVFSNMQSAFIPEEALALQEEGIEESGENDVLGASTFTATTIGPIEDQYFYSTFYERLISKPLTLLQLVFSIIAGLLLVVFLMMIASEARRRHKHHVLVLVALIAVILLVVYVLLPFVFPPVAIAIGL